METGETVASEPLEQAALLLEEPAGVDLVGERGAPVFVAEKIDLIAGAAWIKILPDMGIGSRGGRIGRHPGYEPSNIAGVKITHAD